jgi:hypothetical protein
MGVVLKEPHGDDIEIQLSGSISTDADFPQLRARLSQRIVFDCDGLEVLTPVGATAWSHWMRAFDERQQFVFRFLHERVVRVFSQINGFLPRESTIESFYVPYQCESCNHEDELLARRGKEYIEAVGGHPARLNMPATLNCQHCKNQMNLGVWESKYFRFLEHESTPINNIDE